MLRLSITLAGALTLCACATRETTRYSDRLAYITADCEARGGRLASAAGAGRRAASPLAYQCDMAGGGGRLSAE